jgi:hypothetical protein
VQNLYVGSPMALIYSLGLDLSKINKISFVEVSDYKKAIGDRNLLSNIEICKDISRALGKEFEFYAHNKTKKMVQSISDKDLIDFRIYMKFVDDFKRLNIRPIFLCLAPEISGAHTPSLHKINYGNLKLRIEIMLRVFLKFKIYKFYSIGIKGKKGIFFKEVPINWSLFFEKLDEVSKTLNQNKPSYFTKFSKLDPEKNLLVILPLAEHFGGSLEFNTKMFSIVKEKNKNNSIVQILVKNHPTDSRDYSKLVYEIFPKEISVLSQGIDEINFPLELMVTNFKKIRFAGAFSSIMFSFSAKSQVPSLIFIPNLQKKWVNYTSGSSIKDFDNEKLFI